MWKMRKIRRDFWRVLFLIGFCAGSSLGQGTCVGLTWVLVPGASPQTSTTISSTSLGDCQSSCVSQNSCNGVSWDGSNCNMNVNSSQINYSASSQSIYYSLIRSLSNCNQQSTCSYLWSATKDIHAFGGINWNKTNLNDCVQSCQQNDSCTALDWDTVASSCFLLFSPNPDPYSATGIYHFVRNCQTFTTIPTTTTSTAATATTSTVQSGGYPVTLPGTPQASASIQPGSPGSPGSSGSLPANTNTTLIPIGSSTTSSANNVSSTTTTVSDYDNDRFGGGEDDGGSSSSSLQLAIKPTYIVLAGVGGGCLLLVLTAVIILCQYPLHGAETYSSSGTLVKGRGAYTTQDISMDSAGDGGGEGGEGNVEFNPYYNRSELGAPDFTKEENIM